jgi:hypothetical protein
MKKRKQMNSQEDDVLEKLIHSTNVLMQGSSPKLPTLPTKEELETMKIDKMPDMPGEITIPGKPFRLKNNTKKTFKKGNHRYTFTHTKDKDLHIEVIDSEKHGAVNAKVFVYIDDILDERRSGLTDEGGIWKCADLMAIDPERLAIMIDADGDELYVLLVEKRDVHRKSIAPTYEVMPLGRHAHQFDKVVKSSVSTELSRNGMDSLKNGLDLNKKALEEILNRDQAGSRRS